LHRLLCEFTIPLVGQVAKTEIPTDPAIIHLHPRLITVTIPEDANLLDNQRHWVRRPLVSGVVLDAWLA